MKIFVIAFFDKDRKFNHAIADTDEVDTKRHFKLLEETRSAEKIPHMDLYEVELGEPIQTHFKPEKAKP